MITFEGDKMRSQAIIDLSRLADNYRIYASMLPSGCKPMAVIKANAYGHGDVQIAQELQSHGADDFAVSNIDEAIRVRKSGIQGQILILGYTPTYRAEELVNYDITQALLSEEYAQSLEEKEQPVKCQFAIDSGMRRIGLNADDPDKCAEIIRRYHASKLKLNGLFTHLCIADTDTDDAVAFTKGQIEKFKTVSSKVSDLELPYIHYKNSAGGLWYQDDGSCFARLGIILYGLKPDYRNTLPEGIKPVLTWKSVVSMIKEVRPGDTIGYGRTYRVERPMTVATISTGYADGYSRLLSNKGYVLISGRRAPIVGRVCMDQFTVDVTHIPDVKMGNEVVLIGESGNEVLTADDMAEMLGTIGYEIVCDISERVDRVYVK